MKVYPCISVVIPAYNHEEFIYETIESVLGQSFGDFEFIIINDGSTDDILLTDVGFNDENSKPLNHYV